MPKSVDSIISAGKNAPRATQKVVSRKRVKAQHFDFRPYIREFFVIIVLALTLLSGSVVAVYTGTSMGEYKRYGIEGAAKENIVAMIGAQILSLQNEKQVQAAAVAAQEEAAKIVKRAAAAAASSKAKTTDKELAGNSVAVAASVSLTPQQFLDRTTVALRQKLDGSYGVELKTRLSNSKMIAWYPSDESADIGGSIPKFAVTFSCAEPYDESPSGFSFMIRTSYRCELSLADGKKNVIAAAKKFAFDTGPGLLSAAQAPATSPYFQDGITRSGLIVSNTDNAPITITGLEFDVSFTSIATTTADGRQVALRFSDGDGGAVLAEYFLQNSVPDQMHPSFYASRGVKVAFSLAVNPSSQKLIFIEVLGSHRMGFGNDPTVTLSFTKMDVSPAGIKVIGVPTVVSWTCSAIPNPDNPDRNCR